MKWGSGRFEFASLILAGGAGRNVLVLTDYLGADLASLAKRDLEAFRSPPVSKGPPAFGGVVWRGSAPP